jgi:DNA-directed RNA polymerase specialized sigma24 family protein
MKDEDAAADAVQEALISGFRNFATFRGVSLRSWLARARMQMQKTLPGAGELLPVSYRMEVPLSI